MPRFSSTAQLSGRGVIRACFLRAHRSGRFTDQGSRPAAVPEAPPTFHVKRSPPGRPSDSRPEALAAGFKPRTRRPRISLATEVRLEGRRRLPLEHSSLAGFDFFGTACCWCDTHVASRMVVVAGCRNLWITGFKRCTRWDPTAGIWGTPWDALSASRTRRVALERPPPPSTSPPASLPPKGERC